MNRQERLLATVLELQGRGRATAEQLARAFGVSVRTVYRDIAALNEAGVPVVAAPGQGYWLMPGYFLPPVHLRPEEATLLLLGAGVMAQSFDAEYRDAARAAARKIEAVLPEEQRSEVDHLKRNIRFAHTGGDGRTAVAEMLPRLRGALIARQRVRFEYGKRHGDPETRTVDPHTLVRFDGAWMMSGWCHARRAVRIFRLSRMARLELLGERFERRELEFREHEARMARSQAAQRPLRVRVRFSTEAERWLHEHRTHFEVARERDAAGLVLTLTARHVADVLPWLRRWGPDAEVLEPAELRARLAAEAEALLRRYRAGGEPERAEPSRESEDPSRTAPVRS